MSNNVPKTDGRGIISGMYVNQDHPIDRTQWLEDTFPEWGSFLNQEIENYEVPKLSFPKEADELYAKAARDAKERFDSYKKLADN